ncbi:MAG: hypothetical protein WBA74_09350, partial [Cyclobacteriaceae bacterium]
MRYKPYPAFFLMLVVLALFQCKEATNDFTNEEKLLALAKTYGYIKYFHPSDESASLNWDLFGVVASQKVSDENDLKISLSNLFKPIAPSIFLSDNQTAPKGEQSTKNDTTLKDIYWQHVGNGEHTIGPIYKSARLHRKARVLPESTDDFGYISQMLPKAIIDSVSGKSIKVSLKIKPSKLFTGFSNVFLDVKENGNEKSQRLTFEKSTNENEHTFSLVTQIPESVEKLRLLVVNAIQNGAIYVDDFELNIESNGNWLRLSDNA